MLLGQLHVIRFADKIIHLPGYTLLLLPVTTDTDTNAVVSLGLLYTALDIAFTFHKLLPTSTNQILDLASGT